MTDEFQQPTLDADNTGTDNGKFAASRTPNVPAAVNTGKTDALSVAIANSRKVVAPEPEKPRGPGKYQLDYVYNGELIHETHETIPHAVARVAALKRLGIVPATSVAE